MAAPRNAQSVDSPLIILQAGVVVEVNKDVVKLAGVRTPGLKRLQAVCALVGLCRNTATTEREG